MNQLIKNGELHLYGTVGGDWTWDEDGIKTTGFTDEQVIEALAEIEGDIGVRLNSGGGIAFQGIAIYNALRSHAGKVTIYVDALAASAASVIAMAGDRVVMRPGAMMMIHNPGTITIGTADDHRNAASTLDQIATAAAEIYADRTRRPIREILRMMSAETWLRGEQARTLGFADQAEEEGETMAAPAFKYSLFKHAPAELLATCAEALPRILPLTAPAVHPSKEYNMTTQLSVKDATQDIFARCRSAKLTMEETETVIADAKGNPEKARDLIINALADRSGPEIISHVAVQRSSGGVLQSELSSALLVKLGGKPEVGGDNPFVGLSLVDIGREFYQSSGLSVRGMSTAQVADMMVGVKRAGRPSSFALMSGGMHTTSDFSELLGNVLWRFVTQRFLQTPSVIKGLSVKRSLADFRKHTHIRAGEAPELEEVVEGGEVKYGTLEEEANGLSLKSYAKIFAISRQAIINDDMGALSSSAAVFADAANLLEGRLFYELLSANNFGGALMDDGLPMFHANHSNLAAAGAAISVEALDAARSAMRLQKNVNKTGTAGVVPAVLLVGPKRETAAEKLVASINAATTSNVNPFAGKLRVEVENRYDGVGWWLFADPQQRPAIQHGYLGGVEGPDLQQRDGWDKLGTEFRCSLDFGCAPLDYRAAYFNPGA